MKNKKKYTVLVTGATGFLAKSLIPSLLEEGFYVIGCARRKRQTRDEFPKEKFVFEQCDLKSPKAVKIIFKKYPINCVVHLAAKIGTDGDYLERAEMLRANVFGSHVLASTACAAGIEKFIFTSTMTVYGIPERIPIEESHPLNPLHFYGASKVAAEYVIARVCEIYGASCVIWRLPGLFSPQRHEGAIYNFTVSALNNRPIEITPAKREPWSLLSVDDAARAIISSIKKDRFKSGPYNVAYEEKTNVNIVARIIREIASSHAPIIAKYNMKQPVVSFNTERTKRTFGFSLPPLRQRLHEYIKEVKKQEGRIR